MCVSTGMRFFYCGQQHAYFISVCLRREVTLLDRRDVTFRLLTSVVCFLLYLLLVVIAVLFRSCIRIQNTKSLLCVNNIKDSLSTADTITMQYVHVHT